MSTDDLRERVESTLHDVLLAETGGCACDHAYSERNRIDPTCYYHCSPATNLMADALMPLIAQAQADAIEDAADRLNYPDHPAETLTDGINALYDRAATYAERAG